MKQKSNLTYITATWNREKLLPNLYKSLINQTNKNFVWLIVDDGSTDNTCSLVQNWIEDNKIQIKYFYKENGGKHTALNVAHKECETDYLCYVDSDDYLTINATEVINSYLNNLQNENVIGLVGRRSHYDGTPFSENWPNENKVIYFHELAQKFGYTKDTMLVFKTQILKNFSFPTFKNEKFVTEEIFYNNFLFDYKIQTINECVYFAEYQEGGYTFNSFKLAYNNPQANALYLKQKSYYAYIKIKSIKNAIRYLSSYYAWVKVMKLSKITDFKLPWHVCIVSKLFSCIFYWRYKKKIKNLKSKE